MSEGAAAPALPPELAAGVAAVLAMLGAGGLATMSDEDIDHQSKVAAIRLAKALPFALLSWLNALQKSGELKKLAAAQRADIEASGVEPEDVDSCLMLAMGVLLAKQLQDSLAKEAGLTPQ